MKNLVIVSFQVWFLLAVVIQTSSSWTWKPLNSYKKVLLGSIISICIANCDPSYVSATVIKGNILISKEVQPPTGDKTALYITG